MLSTPARRPSTSPPGQARPGLYAALGGVLDQAALLGNGTASDLQRQQDDRHSQKKGVRYRCIKLFG
jgi:hypothetical protein